MKNLKKTKGFTLIEILIVLAIAIIILSIGIPTFIRGKKNAALKTQALTLKADLELTRTIAKAKSANARLDFDSPSNNSGSYTVKEPDGTVKRRVTFDQGVTADFSALTGTGNLEFRGNGSCVKNGNITVKCTGGTTKTITINISSATGRVKLTE